VGVGSDYHPFADHALTELRTRDVGDHPVLVGLNSRDGWNHPGPALFYLLTPFHVLTRGASLALPLGALAINAVAGLVVLIIVNAAGAVGPELHRPSSRHAWRPSSMPSPPHFPPGTAASSSDQLVPPGSGTAGA
jgi:hypothetical protein